MREYLDSRTFLNGLEQRLLDISNKFAEKLAKELKSNIGKENKELLEEIQKLKSGNEHYGKIIESLEAEKKKLNDVIMQYEKQNLELMKENETLTKKVEKLKECDELSSINEAALQEDKLRLLSRCKKLEEGNRILVEENKKLKKENELLLNENSYLEDNGKRYKLENERMKERLKEKGIEWI